MSWCKARAAVLLVCAALSLAACGFEPMYAKSNDGGRQLATALPDIAIDNIPNRDGQYLRNLLMDQLYTHGRPAEAPYLLTFSPLEKDIVNLGIRKDATATRAQIQISSRMKLIERVTGKTVLTRDFRSVGAYNLLDNQFATLVSQQSITESLLQEMRDSTVTELSLFFRRQAVRPAAPAPAATP